MKRHPAAFPGCGPAPLLAARCRVTETPASWPCLHAPTHLAQVSYSGLGCPRLARVVEATFQSCHQKSWQGPLFRVKLSLPASLFPWCPRLASPSAGLGLQPSFSLLFHPQQKERDLWLRAVWCPAFPSPYSHTPASPGSTWPLGKGAEQ